MVEKVVDKLLRASNNSLNVLLFYCFLYRPLGGKSTRLAG